MIDIELPDGSVIEVEEGKTVEDVAYEIGEGLGDDTVAGKFNGELIGKEQKLERDGELEIVTKDSEEYLNVLRHTASHVMAHALKRLYPDVKLSIGPWTDDGFYYDVTNIDIDKEDLEDIEEEMQKIVEEDLEVGREYKSREEAVQKYEDNEFKQEILEEEASEGDEISFYSQGDFEDLCKGPHVESTGKVQAFKLLDIAGAYWRGDEENDMLTRIYGTAFRTEEELEDYLEKRRKAKENDHRKIGEEMDIFHVDKLAGPGLPLFAPNGAEIYKQLQNYMHELNDEMDHKDVKTQHLFKTELWKKSGHYDNFKDDMFVFEIDEEEFAVKPMNCPGHCLIYDHSSHSYRDLPVRYSEDGTVYRKEQKGELTGLLRVWGFTQDDGHLYCRPDQMKEEVEMLLEKAIEVMETFDLEYIIDVATRDPENKEDYMGSDEIWEKSQETLKEVLEESDMEYGIDEGDAQFYGPKIDLKMVDALGRKWDGPTIQLDFNMPKNFDLTYVDENDEKQRPVMIHRAIIGSYERFMGVLIEHYGGKFPTWLAPEQVRILPVTDENIDYAREIKQELDGYRVDIENRSWTLEKKIKQSHKDNVPYMIIVGGNEERAGEISVRDRNENEVGGIELQEFDERIAEEVDKRKGELEVLQNLQ